VEVAAAAAVQQDNESSRKWQEQAIRKSVENDNQLSIQPHLSAYR